MNMMLTPIFDLRSRVERLVQLGLLALMLPTLTISTLAQIPALPGKSVSTTAKPTSLTVANKRYDATKELARMSRHYSLTEEQRVKIQPLLLEQQRQIHALGEDTTLTDTEWNSSVHKVHLNTVAQIKLQLTDAQALKYTKDEAKASKQQGNSDDAGDDGPPDGGPPPGGGPGGPGGGPGGGGPPGM